jgi:hypothetical protein
METVCDWVTLSIFAGLIVLFLQRSVSERAEKDASLFYYLGAGAGCAAANYFGNEGQHVIAVAILVATVAFVIYFLKPFNFGRG